MALAAESATGFVLGMNLPADKLPLIKTMHVDYVRRARGSIRAEASLTPEQIDRLATRLISRDSILNEEDREWLEVFIQASTDPDKSLKKTAAAIVALHYRGVPDNATIH